MIKRFRIGTGRRDDEQGEVVKFADHGRAVAVLCELLREYRNSQGVDAQGRARENHMACSCGLSDAIWGKPYDRRCDLCKRTDALLKAHAGVCGSGKETK